MSARYRCLSGRRLEKLRVAGALNGIEFVEVVDFGASLTVTFVKPDGLAALKKENIRIAGGVRRAAPRATGLAVAGRALKVTLAGGQSTDFSTYRLTLVDDDGSTPAGFDSESASVEFSFKIECASPFDCRDAETPAAAPSDEPRLDYAARDWSGFRSLMLDRLSALLPGFSDDTPVDSLVTQVEALAYVADHLSYRLDAIANETDLFRARSRISVARHARLLDYAVHEGANARCFVQLSYSGPDGVELPAATPVTIRTRFAGAAISPDDFRTVAPFAPATFETMHALRLVGANSRIDFHTWSDERCTLRRGATRATLRRAAPGGDAQLAAGDFLILMETASPTTGLPADADKLKRCAVRLTGASLRKDLVENVDVLEISWNADDALPFDLVLSTEIARPGEAAHSTVCAQAFGNVVLADHGLTLPVAGLTQSDTRALTPRLEPASAPATGRWSPRILAGPIARAAPVDLSVEAGLSAQAVLVNDPQSALPAVSLTDNFKPWKARRDLFASERFDRHFVVETEADGVARLRFGDDILGLAPMPGQSMTVRARIGAPEDGGVGADALTQIVTTIPNIDAVTNPLPAQGAAQPLDLGRARIEAPYAFMRQERAVTEADWVEATQRHPQVSRAKAQIRWTGSWRTCFVYVDRVGGAPVETDPVFRAELLRYLDAFRLCGVDLALRDAVAVALDVKLTICAAPGALRANLRRDLANRLGSGVLADGRPAFFHPDNFTFGSPLYVSRLIAAAMAAPGVASARATTFRRRGKVDAGELQAGVVTPVDFEILRLDSDPNRPENGLLELDIQGGA